MNSDNRKKLLEELAITMQEGHVNNKNLFKEMTAEFVNKGLSQNTISNLRENCLDDKTDVEDLIAITKTMKSVNEHTFSLEKYFDDREIKEYNELIKLGVKKIDSALFKKVIKNSSGSGKSFTCFVSAKQLYELRKNQIIRYNVKYQRATKIVTTATGKTYEKADINAEGLKDLRERFTKGDIFPTAISLSIMPDRNGLLNENNYRFKDIYTTDVGDLWIKPIYTTDGTEQLQLNITDGAHRYFALTDAYEEKLLNDKEELNYSIVVNIHIMSKEEARTFVEDAFKRNDTDVEYLKSLSVTDENKFIEEFEKESVILNNHVANTTRELRLDSKFVSKQSLIKGFEETGITMDNNNIASEMEREEIACHLDKLLDSYNLEYVLKKEIDSKDSILFYDKMFVYHIKFLSRAKDSNITKVNFNYLKLIDENAERLNKVKGKKEFYDLMNEILSEVLNDGH